MPDYTTLQISWLDYQKSSDLPFPARHSDLAAGLDVAAAVEEDIIMEPGEIRVIASGFSVAIPEGYEIQIRPRSGLAVKHGITVVNSPGTIDADYRGEVKIGLINLGRSSFVIRRGDRIAQMVMAPVTRAVIQVVEQLSESRRQDGGFGHTGI
ncbi:MAG: dUTP diphosphatase [Thermodesulfobacteriota bacterium]